MPSDSQDVRSPGGVLVLDNGFPALDLTAESECKLPSERCIPVQGKLLPTAAFPGST